MTTTGSGAQEEERLQGAPLGQIPDPQKEERLQGASWSSGRDAHVGPDTGTSARRVDFLKDFAFAPSQKGIFSAGALRAPATHGGPRPLRGGRAGRQAQGDVGADGQKEERLGAGKTGRRTRAPPRLSQFAPPPGQMSFLYRHL